MFNNIAMSRQNHYLYALAVGDPDSGIVPGTAWKDISKDWVCPVRGLAKDVFTPVE